MFDALSSELFRLRRRPQFWIMPLLALVFIAVFYAIIALVFGFGSDTDQAGVRDSLRIDNAFDNGMQVFGVFGVILIVIVTSGLIGSEFGWNTIRPLVARSPSRTGLLTAKWITVLLYTLLMVVVGAVGSILLATAASAVAGTATTVPGDFWADVPVEIGRWLLSSLPYATLGFAAALLTRSNAAGISIGIGLSFVEPILFSLLILLVPSFDTIQRYGISWNAVEITQATGADAVQAAVLLLVYMGLLIASTYAVFNRRDITG